MSEPQQHKWDAEEYDRHSSAQRRWAREMLDKLQLRGGENILDIGCGDGQITLEIARLLPGGNITGIDSSPDMIAFAQKRLAEAPCPNASFEIMDAAAITYAGQFDIAFSNAALHWVSDNRPVLEGVHRALKPGGRILFQMGGRGNAGTLFTAVVNAMINPRWKDHFNDFAMPYRFYGPDEYTALLEQAGFEPRHVALSPRDMAHPPEGFAGWFRTTGLPFTERLPEAEREDFIAAVLAGYTAANPPGPDGLLHVPMMRLEVEAVKA